MNRRRKRGTPFAAYAALVFNAALCLTPFVAAKAVSTAYGDNLPQYEGSSEALAATRQALDGRFARLASTGEGAPREVWSQYIREELDSGDMTTVRGFLLAAPAMLRGNDGDSLRARLAVADGGGEETLINAAVAYLPEDVQEIYEKKNAPPTVAFLSNAAPQQAVEIMEASRLARDDDDRPAFRMLGKLSELAITAGTWDRDPRFDEFAFVMAGLGLTTVDEQSGEGASVVLSARRAKRLDPKFELYLQKKLYAAAPPARLKRALAGEVKPENGGIANTPVIQRVFQTSVDRVALQSLESDLRVIRDIAHETSPVSAVAVLSQVRDGVDLRRARLVAQAGGDRAVALARYDGANFLDAARTVVRWNNTLRMQLVGLGLCVGLLGAIAMSVLWRSFRRAAPKRRSAVYALDEIPGAV